MRKRGEAWSPRTLIALLFLLPFGCVSDAEKAEECEQITTQEECSDNGCDFNQISGSNEAISNGMCNGSEDPSFGCFLESGR